MDLLETELTIIYTNGIFNKKKEHQKVIDVDRKKNPK